MTNGTIYYPSYHEFLNRTKWDQIFIIPAQVKQWVVKTKRNLISILIFIGFIVLSPITVPTLFIFAQVAPILFKNHLDKIIPHLPYIDDFNVLSVIKDIFAIYFYALKSYRPFCVFTRNKLDDLVDELDEHIDSLEYVVKKHELLSTAVDKIEARC